jgi:hypothetical protein
MKTNYFSMALVLVAALLLAGCGSRPRVGELQSETQSVELGDAKSINVKINMGAGNLVVSGGAEKLLDADFTYNVARLKPEVEYKNDMLLVQQPDVKGLPDVRGVTGYRNEWRLLLNNGVPMDLHVDIGAGTSDLKLAGLPLKKLDITQGAGASTIDLSGDWVGDLDATIETGAADVTVRLPSSIGVRVEVDRGPTAIDASGLTQDGDIYTNTAYGKSPVTLDVHVKAGIGLVNLEVIDDQ